MPDTEPSCFDRCEGVVPSLCDGDVSNNYWVEGGTCMLDQMTKDQVVYSIQHSPQARRDLARVTTCLEIHQLLDQVPLLSPIQEDDAIQSEFNKADCLPFYSVLRGNMTDR